MLKHQPRASWRRHSSQQGDKPPACFSTARRCRGCGWPWGRCPPPAGLRGAVTSGKTSLPGSPVPRDVVAVVPEHAVDLGWPGPAHQCRLCQVSSGKVAFNPTPELKPAEGSSRETSVFRGDEAEYPLGPRELPGSSRPSTDSALGGRSRSRGVFRVCAEQAWPLGPPLATALLWVGWPAGSCRRRAGPGSGAQLPDCTRTSEARPSVSRGRPGHGVQDSDIVLRSGRSMFLNRCSGTRL